MDIARWLAHLRTIFAWERLPPPPPEAPPRARRPALPLLFGREPLPLEPVPPRPRRAQWLRWLFVPESLDADPSRPEVE